MLGFAPASLPMHAEAAGRRVSERAALRVAMVSETYPPEINGVALTVAALADGLVELGHEVSVIRPRRSRTDQPASRPRYRELLVPGQALPRYRELRFGWPVLWRIRRDWLAARPNAVYIATEGPLGWAAMWAARSLGIPVASGFHTRFDDYLAHYALGLLRAPAFAYLRAFHNRAQATLVPTEELRSFLAGHGFRHPRILSRGVNAAAFDPARRDPQLRRQWGLDDADPAVLFVGRIAPEKNLALVVEAYQRIRQRHPRARLIWVGDGPSRAALAEAHPEHVHCGMQRGAELGRHYASADLFLFPSLTETFGNVTLEAMASGLVTLAYAYGAAGQHLCHGENGYTATFGSHAAYLASLEQMLDEHARWPAIRLAARRSAEALAPARVSESFASLLAGLDPLKERLA